MLLRGFAKSRSFAALRMTMLRYCGEVGVGDDFYGVGFCDGAAGAVVDCWTYLGGDVLDECAAAPDV